MSFWQAATGHTWPSEIPVGDDRCQTCGCTYGTQGNRQCMQPASPHLDGQAETTALMTTGGQPRLAERPQGRHGQHEANGHAPVTVLGLLRTGAETRWAEIERLLRALFEQDLTAMREKALNYGASDLEIMAKANERLLPGSERLTREQREQAGMEMAIGHYLLGKSSRLYGAWENGNAPSSDTWYDAYVYALMGRVVRHTGRWM